MPRNFSSLRRADLDSRDRLTERHGAMRKLIYGMNLTLDGYIAARRRPRLERAERRAVSVVARPGVGDRAVDVRAQAVGGDEFPLADRRPAAQRQPGDRVRAELAGHAEGGVLLDDRQGRLEHPPGHRRRCSGDHPLKADDGEPMRVGGATLAGAAMRAGLVDEYEIGRPIRCWWAAAHRSSPRWTAG